ncbi:hypothetical protein BO71DRAFT_407623 [Aspergillus ellipticus CBS 707.79]|uniref:RING-type domain-containing protein n=1 Tax=Aspergillus ellipticus CBS 707.79 TaxID=1448320 RepID=A0A319DQZ7_9EURO|nr:hypothetical protein BO71DRAFT_407623 [Aspergillus ellipticus CBS 707.79]
MAGVIQQELDQDTTELIVQMQREDAVRYFESKGAHIHASTDEDLAFRSLLDDLDNTEKLLRDRQIVNSIAGAVQTDQASASKPRNARGHAKPVRGIRSSLEHMFFDDKIPLKLLTQYIFTAANYNRDKDDMENRNSQTEHADSSSSGSRRGAKSPRPMHHCVACGEETKLSDLACVPCGHIYCGSCYGEAIRNLHNGRVPVSSKMLQKPHHHRCSPCASELGCDNTAHMGDCPKDNAALAVPIFVTCVESLRHALAVT